MHRCRSHSWNRNSRAPLEEANYSGRVHDEFIADIEGIETNTPIVYDDPITSLDQEFEESVVA
jgi:hypothetical protein